MGNNESLEQLESMSNINLLDDDKNTSEVNVVTPEVILDQYSKYDLANEEIDIKIEEVKAKYKECFDEINKLNEEKLKNVEIQNKLKVELKEKLIEVDQKTVKNQYWTVTYVAPYEKTTFDRAKFEKKYPVLARQFITKSTVAGSTRWTKKK